MTLLSSGVLREGPRARQPAGSTGFNQRNGDQNLRNGSFLVHKQPSLRPPCRKGGGATWGQEGPSGPRGQPGARHAPALIGTRRPAAGVLPVEPVPTKIHLGGRRRAGSFPQAPSRCQQRTGAASDPIRPHRGVSIRGTAASRCPKSSRAPVRSASRSGARRGEGPRGRVGPGSPAIPHRGWGAHPSAPTLRSLPPEVKLGVPKPGRSCPRGGLPSPPDPEGGEKCRRGGLEGFRGFMGATAGTHRGCPRPGPAMWGRSGRSGRTRRRRTRRPRRWGSPGCGPRPWWPPAAPAGRWASTARGDEPRAAPGPAPAPRATTGPPGGHHRRHGHRRHGHRHRSAPAAATSPTRPPPGCRAARL